MKYNEIFNEEVLILDSMNILSLHFKSKNIIIQSKNLENIYNYFFSDKVKAHRAEEDVEMLIKIFEKNEIDCHSIQNMI